LSQLGLNNDQNLPASFIRFTPPLHCTIDGHINTSIVAMDVDRLVMSSIATSLPSTFIATVEHADFKTEIRCGAVSIKGELAFVTPQSDDDRANLNKLLTTFRKLQHIDLCETKDVEHSERTNGFAEYSFEPCALPELNWDELDTSTTLFGRKFSTPLLITGMTGGVERGELINRRLAAAAAKLSVPMGIGSQRMAIEHREFARIFDVKKWQPSVFLIGNIGMAQLTKPNALDICRAAVEMIGADALAIHLNPLQELIQAEGDRSFRGVLASIEQIVSKLNVPVMIKEVGTGLDRRSAARLIKAGVKTFDVGGSGGTSWSRIEGLRSADQWTAQLGEDFRNFGTPTAVAVRELRVAHPHADLIATGGIRSGLDVAKALALGANAVGIGLPLLRAALKDENAATDVLSYFNRGLKIAMMASGCATILDLERALRRHGFPNATTIQRLTSEVDEHGF
jgi:isopentenyl-diphosphate delta-isomerase